ncbi:biotin/lipoyl-binding protein [Clostridium sediminicola]|uniref:biotin/lipoyl-containing protein n=1 Tax=Clostridium sediminicola TaxID=3114879 RepID=UPI0031F245C4
MKKYKIKLNGKLYEVEVEEIFESEDSNDKPIETQKHRELSVASDVKSEDILAPLSGNILGIEVKNGQHVRAGEVLLILEAMKLENEVVAPKDGIIENIIIQKGTSVNVGDRLIVMK